MSFLPSSAWAANAYVICVQNELAALGYSGFAADGKINAATQGAVQAFAAKHANKRAIALIPKISDKTAVSWCREIASVHPALRSKMPAGTAPIVVSDGGNGSVQTAMLARAFQETEQFFRKRYGIYTASRVDVAGSDSGAKLAKLAVNLQKTRGPSYGRMGTFVARICKTPSIRYGGQAYLDQLLICWPTTNQHDAAWRNKSALIVTSIMVHEYMHHVQREFANDKISAGHAARRGKRGPAWMVEGTAELVEYRWRAGKAAKYRLSFERLQRDARASPKQLRAMRDHGTVKGAEQYRIARFATYLLAERFGDQSLFDYWRLIGQGHKWDKAFELAFGLRLAAYEAQFAKLRVDPAKAAAFANRK